MRESQVETFIGLQAAGESNKRSQTKTDTDRQTRGERTCPTGEKK